ncbi:hypothetical protein HHK36_028108 [Tetracentron sinense]|uniref:Casein kinase II subunit beta n=1 Tax=Tetracentron sinense TaxID=13715 RepID=A0A834YIV1_TETSI|nr:hypothetical protein HHK36_028108 [Tetracentron sinense]
MRGAIEQFDLEEIFSRSSPARELAAYLRRFGFFGTGLAEAKIWACMDNPGSICLLWSCTGDMFTEEQNEMVESEAEMLYGLIHVRYILTSKGMSAMLEKYKSNDFGRCPRVYCCGQPCLPVGQSDIPRSSTVKIYCPKCEDVYYPRSKYQGSILPSIK